MDGKLSTIRLMFPNATSEQALNALKNSNWDLDQTIDLLLAETAVEENNNNNNTDIVLPPPPPPTSSSSSNNNALDEESERILNEFLLMEKQYQQNQRANLPLPPPPVSSSDVEFTKPSVLPPPPPVSAPAAVPRLSLPPHLIPQQAIVLPPPIPSPIVIPQSHTTHLIQTESVIMPEPSCAQRVNQEAIESTQRDISLIQSITNTLRELEMEVKNLNLFNIGGSNNNNNNNNVNNDDEIKQREPGHSEDQDENEDVIERNPLNESVIYHDHNRTQDKLVEDVERVQENNNNNNNKEQEDLVEKLFGKKLPVDIDNAVVQIESLFNSSMERSEKVLKSLKEEIDSWKIKDNVKTITSTLRKEVVDIIETISKYINPEFTEEQRREREAKRVELEKKLQDLRVQNEKLEEQQQVATDIAPPNNLPPPVFPQQGYYYYSPNAPNVYYYSQTPIDPSTVVFPSNQ